MNTPVSVLGLGAMGSAVARTLLRHGHPTTVWNRSPGRADPLAAAGATVSAAPAAAVRGTSALVVMSLTDYGAVDAILDAAGGALAGRVVLNLTTGSPREARATAARAEALGARYLDGVVQAAPEQLGTPDALLLHAGPPDAFAEHRATLERLGTTTFLGDEVDRACRYDLVLLGLWYDAQLAYLDALALLGLDTATTFAPFAATQLGHVVNAARETAREVAERTYPRGPASLTEHARVLDRLVELRRDRGMDTDHVAGLRDLVALLIEQGHGADGYTRVVTGLTPRR